MSGRGDSPPAEAPAVERFGFLDAPAGRRLRARRIVRVLEDFVGAPCSGLQVLDVGCSAGYIIDAVAGAVGRAWGVDADAGSIVTAARLHADTPNLAFCVASGEQLPFADRSFDVVICNHVYEHVGDPFRLMAEIRRVLRDQGACYFAGGHRLQLVEPHHRLPLLSWLPPTLADRYLRLFRHGDRYTERFLPPWRIYALFAGFARRRMVSMDMLSDPRRYLLEQPLARWLRPLARTPGARVLLAWLAPTQVWMLWK
jgi:2-polyprenyl-3-methyl-5-hydroxy-6-metoxy-1,4-benzoquinol methylase